MPVLADPERLWPGKRWLSSRPAHSAVGVSPFRLVGRDDPERWAGGIFGTISDRHLGGDVLADRQDVVDPLSRIQRIVGPHRLQLPVLVEAECGRTRRLESLRTPLDQVA